MQMSVYVMLSWRHMTMSPVNLSYLTWTLESRSLSGSDAARQIRSLTSLYSLPKMSRPASLRFASASIALSSSVSFQLRSFSGSAASSTPLAAAVSRIAWNSVSIRRTDSSIPLSSASASGSDPGTPFSASSACSRLRVTSASWK